ncbi:MAG: type I secretion protein TolC [Methylococcales bacterium]|nr:MAG: type I secretion protein TolC [Methylococcales bacterium]
MRLFKYGLLTLTLACAMGAQADDLLFIYQQALDADPNSRSAEEKTGIGTAQKGQALGQMLPQLSLSGNWSTNRYTQTGARTNANPISHDAISNYPGTRYYVSLNQSLMDFAKFWAWRQATKVEDQYATEAIEAHNQLMFNVVDRYFSELQAEDELYFAQTEKQSTEKRLEQIQKQYAKQLLKITDLYAMEARLDQLKAAEIVSESKLVTAQAALRELTGSVAAPLSKLKDQVEYPEIQGDLQQWLDMAQSQNPAISAKQKAVIAAETNVIAQNAKHLPTADLQLNYYNTNTGYQSSQQLPYNVETAAINVNVPIFSGGIITNQVKEARYRLQMSKNDNEATMRFIIKETSDAFLSTNAATHSIKASQRAQESTSKSLQAMEKGYQLGVVTISDLIKAQQDEFSAKKELAIAKYNYIKNRIRFMHAIGSIGEENLHEVNNWLETKNQ